MVNLVLVTTKYLTNKLYYCETKLIGELWTLTGGVIISGDGFTVIIVAVVSKKGLVVVVFIPVERLDFEAPSLRMSTDDT